MKNLNTKSEEVESIDDLKRTEKILMEPHGVMANQILYGTPIKAGCVITSNLLTDLKHLETNLEEVESINDLKRDVESWPIKSVMEPQSWLDKSEQS